MKITVVYDAYIPEEYFRKAFASLSKQHEVRFVKLDELRRDTPETDSEKAIREYSGSAKELAGLMKDEDVLVVHVAPVTEEVLQASANLKAVFCARGGPVNIDVASATRRKILVVSSPGRNADAVADFALGLMIALSRNLLRGTDLVKGRLQFNREEYEALFGHELGGKTLGLVGFGNVGSRVATRALGFGMEVLVYDPFVEKSSFEAPGITAASLDDLLRSSDYVSVHARESPDNENLIGAEQFGLMKPSAYFLNTARGSLVDEAALYDALVSKKIAGAALDVMKQEPMDPKSPLLTLQNVIVTPHIAGASYEVRFRGAEIAGRQVEKWAAGQPLTGVLNPQVRGTAP
jgi:D-3-phosphoglycerate dehydrogenase / 2-oxoglutarate reductase